MTLTDFLLARIAEDEAGARFAAGPGWVRPAGDSWRVSPAHVLAECEAKRRIVDEHGGGKYHVDPCDTHDASMRSIPCDTLRHLATVYADHPDYDDESWRA